MKTPFHSCNKPARFFGVALSLAVGLFGFGALMMPAAAIAAAVGPQVPVAQQPLTIQQPIPPDIVLMLDDSGSMNWDYMPDACYLYGVTCTGTSDGTNPTNGQGVDYVQSANNDALIDSANNGVYYNPTVTYTPPPQSNGTSYATYTDITNVPLSGFKTSGNWADVTQYSHPDVSGEVEACGIPGQSDCNTSLDYSATSTGPSYNISFNQTVSAYYTYPADQVCRYYFSTYSGAANYSFTGLTKDNSGNWSTGTCKFTYTSTTYHYFQYSVGPANGPYVVHYVAPAFQGCGAQTNCVVDSDTSGTAAPAKDASGNALKAGTNIANWFAYYHTRILMAKSGLMTAFATLDSNFRVGFGSINGNNRSFINGLTNKYAFATSTRANNVLAEVAPFGKPSDASTNTGISRFNLWNWIVGESASGGTPLRQALDAVGQYYSGTDSTTPASNAWDMMSSDPGYSTTGPNSTQIACRQAYTILTTDGFWNSSYSDAGNADGTAGTAVPGPNGQSYTYSPAAPYSDSNSDTLADVAMKYWETDLQPNIDNEVPPSTEDPAFWQHMVTFTLGLGFTPTGIQPAGTTIQQIFDWANGGSAIANFLWPQPSSNSINNIADLAHAGVNGHGGFFSATDPQTFVSGIEGALQRATERIGTGASLAANSTQLTNGTVIYQANYYTSTWAGNLKAFAVNPATGAIATSPTWQAYQHMPAPSARNIQTWNGTAFVAFQNGASAPPNLSTAQLAALGSDATTQENIVNYLRGDHSLEQQHGKTLRTRHTVALGDWVLGDIVDSQPVFSGPPNPDEFVSQSFYGTVVDSNNNIPFYDWAVGTTDTNGVFTASAASQRTPYIFVAANDGMLHAFNANTGAETFAYLPGAVITAGLANLANPAYGTAADPHQFYNDGQLTIADAYLPSLTQINGSSWHTILVGTTGRGSAEAVYALDITDPTNIVPLWERSANDGKTNSNYIGQMVGKPVIAQTNNAAATKNSAASSTWSVLIGNGYNSQKGVAALLQFNLATGDLTVHTTDSSTSNGLAAPVAWMDVPADGVSDVAYAGDLLGRVWSFPLNDNTGSNPTPSSAGTLLFQAKDASGNAQPITAGMLAGKNSKTGDVWLFFGTGKYLAASDLTDASTQTWYGIIVQSASSPVVTSSTGRCANSTSKSCLVQRKITAQTAGGSGSLPARTVSTQSVTSGGATDMSGESGWYMDLLAPVGTNNAPVQQGERMVDPNEFQGSLLIGVTRVPKVTDICNPSGSGWIMALDPFTGTAPSADFFDVNNDGYINSGDQMNGSHAAGVGFGSLPNAPIFVGGVMETSFDNGTTASLKTAGTVGTVGRVSWRELVNP